MLRKHFLTRYTVKNGISNLYILLKMQEIPFQRPKFQNGISNLYILLKMQVMPFQRPKFQKKKTLQLCRHYGIPLTKILATPLSASQTQIQNNMVMWIAGDNLVQWRFDNVEINYLNLSLTDILKLNHTCDIIDFINSGKSINHSILYNKIS